MRVKICGVTSVRDALMCAAAGADAIGVNLISPGARFVDEVRAKEIADAIRGRCMSVGVVADLSADAMLAFRDRIGVACLQLHGSERPEDLAPLLPHAYKAIRVATAADVATADSFGGEYILVDTKVDDARGVVLGGTGRVFDWSLVAALAKKRRLTLAGGLHAENVEEAIRALSPYCVDVASGVETAGNPREKDAAKTAAFIERAKRG